LVFGGDFRFVARSRSLPRRLLLFFAVVCFQRGSRGLRRFLDKKEAKNQVSREASLPHKAIALQNG